MSGNRCSVCCSAVFMFVIGSSVLSTVNSVTLFQPGSLVDQLWANNFSSVIHGSSRVWIVDFYASWCGHCQHVAPLYESLARDIQAWKPVVGVAAVACSDMSNNALCRNHGISGYPTIKFYRPNAAANGHGHTYQGTKTEQHLRSGVLRYLARLIHQGHGHHSWPNLDHVRRISDLRASGRRKVFIIVEDEHSVFQHIGKMVILDMLPFNSSVLVGRMLLNNARFYGITERGLFGLTLFQSLFPISSEYSREALVATIQHEAGLHVRRTTTRRPSTVAGVTEQQSKLEPGLHEQDLESNLYYSLWSEIPSRTSFNETALAALKLYINVLARYLPGESHIKNFLNKTDHWIRTKTAPLTTSEWLHYITNSQTADAYIPSRVRWTWCRGSQPQFRGYPCSLWMTFHALTIGAYNLELGNASYSPLEVISSIRQYVANFLGCRECARNFGRGAHQVLDVGNSSARYRNHRDGAVMWLWTSHNRANFHLQGDSTEDPEYPKIQFPTVSACPECQHDSNAQSHTIQWNENAVLMYLRRYYGSSHIIDDDIHDDTGVTTTATEPTTTLSTNIISGQSQASSGSCPVVNSDWTPCSRTCNVGTSIRLTNDNADCRTQVQVRLCLVRPCVVRFPDWTRSAWHAANCPRLGHTYRLNRPRTLQFGNCTTLVPELWRVCGRCPPTSHGQSVCCRPERSRTQLRDIECRRADGLGDVVI